MKDNYGRPVEVASEIVTDCSIYDGWWDNNTTKIKGIFVLSNTVTFH